MYDLPNFNSEDFKKKLQDFKKLWNVRVFWVVILSLVIVSSLSVSAAVFLNNYSDKIKTLAQVIGQDTNSVLKQNNVNVTTEPQYSSDSSYEQAIINAVEIANPSVVSIVISKNMPIYEQQWINPFGDGSGFDIQIPQYVQNGTKYQQIGAGSGFIVSTDGLVLTNKHVVSEKDADYTVVASDGQKYTAKVLAQDPVQDLAVLRISNANGKTFSPLKLGDSSGIKIGQTAIAIGNALGEFSNTVSVGVVSGLGRTISASDQTGSLNETLDDIIQTDAAINSGNSGGPLLNLKGEVIGINTAMAQGAENVAFAIPVNYAKKDIQQVITSNKITYPFLGIRYVLVDASVKSEYKLSVDYGALVLKGSNGEQAVTPGSAAANAGIKENDIILEFGGQKITTDNTLAKMIQQKSAGDKVTLKLFRNGQEMNVDVTLGQR